MRKLKGSSSCIAGGIAVAAAVLAQTPSAHAAFSLVDDFGRPDNTVVGGGFAGDEVDGDPTYSGLGPQVQLISGQMQLYANTEDTYSGDTRAYTIPGIVGTGGNPAGKNNTPPAITGVATATTQTIFFQQTLTTAVAGSAGTWNSGFGISSSHNAASHSYDLITVYANGSGTSLPLTINDKATGDFTHNNAAALTTPTSVTVGTQYNFWMVLHNDTKTMDLYDSVGTGAATLIESGAAYNVNAALTNPVSGDPVTLVFYGNSVVATTNGEGQVGNGANGSNSFNEDNVYIDNGSVDLVNPAAVPEPASIGMLGLAAGGLVLRRSKKRSV